MDTKNLVKLNPDLEYLVTLKLIIFAIEGKNDTKLEKSDIRFCLYYGVVSTL